MDILPKNLYQPLDFLVESLSSDIDVAQCSEVDRQEFLFAQCGGHEFEDQELFCCARSISLKFRFQFGVIPHSQRARTPMREEVSNLFPC